VVAHGLSGQTRFGQPLGRTLERAGAHDVSVVQSGDYPASAVAAREAGAVGFTISIGVDGEVSQCIVTGSSGSAALDAVICSVAKTRFRFGPARDLRGEAAPDMMSSNVRW
jgi:periplasmic protein TonB